MKISLIGLCFITCFSEFLLCIYLFLYIVIAVYSTCPGDNICKGSYNGSRGAILRVDDGDVFISVFGSSNNCTNHSALCIDNDCSACKFKTIETSDLQLQPNVKSTYFGIIHYDI